MSAVNVGVALPVREVAILGSHDAAPLLKMARQVEESGFDAVWVGDSFVARHRLEPLTMLAAIAMVTDRITIGTAALTAVLREPLTLAHTIVTLDQLAPGRLKLGIGTGAPLPVQSEYDAVTMSYRERADRVDEAVALWRRAWRREDGDLVGEYYDLDGLRLQMPPADLGGPALWLASNGKPGAVRRVARHYDGWLPILITPEQYAKSLAAIRAEAEAAGRDPDAIETGLYVTVNINDSRDEATAGLDDYTHRYNDLPLPAMAAYQLYYGGSAADLAGWLSAYVEAGARNIVLRIGSFDAYERNVQAVAEGVVPVLHALDVG
jgi:alkanesulfonate monooxygenase SsuD/methylene tetrahydromethanopterin reductase-like flavin-dependent oxidoreductase (luciferase family)